MTDTIEFKEKLNQSKNYKPRGASGTLVTGFEIQSDYLFELNGTTGQDIFEKMLLSDATIRKLYHAVSNPIKSAVWDIEPASDDPIDLEAANLIKHIIFKDLEGGFKTKLNEILEFPWKGHSVFEIVHKNYNKEGFGEYTGLDQLGFRDQRTLDKWEFENGRLKRIHQLQHGDIPVNAWMDAKNLLIFYNSKKGNDNGYPFCRMLYGNYKRKLLYKQLQAIGIERGAIPVPHLKLPPSVDYDSDAYEDAVRQLENFTQAEQAFFVTPDGYDLEYHKTDSFDPSKVQVAIKGENEEIAGSLVAMWLEMGIGGNSAVGSSTAESLEFFRDGIEYIADGVAEPFNNILIPSLVKMNFGDAVKNYPELKHSGIADEAGEELMRIVTGYAQSSIITPDEPLEDHVRKSHNLPKKAEGEMVENEAAQDGDSESDNTAIPNNNNEPDEQMELAEKDPKTPKTLIRQQQEKIARSIREALRFTSSKYINDVLVKYRKLSDSKKQNATNNINLGGMANLRKDLRRLLSETAALSIEMAKSEIPSKENVELTSKEREMNRMIDTYGDISDIKLNEFSKLPTHIQVLIAKQSELITEASLVELRERLDFQFSSIELKSSDEAVIKQSMEETANDFIQSNQIETKGANVSAIVVNEGREAFFFEPDVLEEIHSFTFVNIAPKAPICRELAGTTFNTNDAESLRYTPPLHHNCKSYLRANLKSSSGTSRLEVSTLSPSAEAKRSITL